MIVAKWVLFSKRIIEGLTVRDNLDTQKLDEKKHWREILIKVVDVIRFLAKQDLPFRGHIESFRSDENAGNYLETMKVLAKYDPILESHLKFAAENPRSVDIATTHF